MSDKIEGLISGLNRQTELEQHLDEMDTRIALLKGRMRTSEEIQDVLSGHREKTDERLYEIEKHQTRNAEDILSMRESVGLVDQSVDKLEDRVTKLEHLVTAMKQWYHEMDLRFERAGERLDEIRAIRKTAPKEKRYCDGVCTSCSTFYYLEGGCDCEEPRVVHLEQILTAVTQQEEK